ncbi:LuxR C-terminal-related transcriptional regulator [Rhodococcus sp. NPDC127528]|uniref:helix-turn-helix transcriptional regulator n=1 Tax=unclassified Rhodococcus (in: high G+C Gram-positive bacteria) TaxID=192944 RepID=UPI00363D3583
MIGGWPLTGRVEELRLTTEAIGGSADRAGIVLAGAAGVGKTRLATEALTWARAHGFRTRWVVATASARALPLGPFSDLPGGLGPDPTGRVQRVIESLADGGRGQRRVLGVDDAHLLDDMSAFVVQQLVMRRKATVVVTVRSGAPAPDAVTALWKDRHLERLELQALSLEETHGLLEAALSGQVDSDSARRLWELTRGNILFLSQLVADEVSADRMKQCAQVWIWEGNPVVSPSLSELVDARMGRLSGSVGDVVDCLSVCEPLEVEVLSRLTDPTAVEQAEEQSLVTVEHDGAERRVRLAHPLFGEVRRSRSSDMRLCRLRGRVAHQLASAGDRDSRAVLRRAVLALDSDEAPDPDLLVDGSRAAMQFYDPTLAGTLATAASAAGGGVAARLAHAMTLVLLGRAGDAEAVLARLDSDAPVGPDGVRVTALRASNLVWMLGEPERAVRVLDSGERRAGRRGADAACRAARASVHAVQGRFEAAAAEAASALTSSELSGFHAIMAVGVQVLALGGLGRVDEVRAVADRGYEVADGSSEASPRRFWLGALEARAFRVGGLLDASMALARRLRCDSAGAPGLAQAMTALLVGHAELGLGRLDAAVRWLREALAGAETYDTSTGLRPASLMWLTEALGMAGDKAAAATTLAELDSARHSSFTFMDSGASLARAWASAAEGATSSAIETARAAGDRAAARGHRGYEVACLQAATQFGDSSTAPRLAELARAVQGPRVQAASAHAAALAAAAGPALEVASRRYEAFGDRLAAADAAAQASIEFRRSDRRGSALTAAATARRLAVACEGADTPALRAATQPVTLTGRQLEIASLAADGLSNRQIADRLVVSVRTVEGHIYRVLRLTGVDTRDELKSVLRGRT